MKKTFLSVLLLFIAVYFLSAQDEHVLLENLDQAEDDSAKISAMLNLADYYTYSDVAKAKEYLEKSEDLLNNIDDERYDFLQATLYNKKGTFYSIKGDYGKALENYHKTLLLLEKMIKNNPDSKYLHEAAIAPGANMAIIYLQLENYRKAIATFNELLEKSGDYLTRMKKALIYNNVGVAYHSLNQFDSSLVFYRKALSLTDTSADPKYAAMLYTNMGEDYAGMGNYRKAEQLFNKSLKIKKRLKDNYGYVNVLLSLAKMQYKTGEYDKAGKNAQELLKITDENNYLKEKRDALLLLSDIFNAKKDFKEAYDYFKKYKEVNDSIFNMEKHNKLLELETKYETEKKDNQLRMLRQKEKTDRMVKYLLLAGIFFVAFAALIIIRSSVIKRKNERRLFAINKQLKEKENRLMRAELEKKEMKTEELNKEIEYKSKQLTTHALNMLQKNEMLENIITEINELQKRAKPEVKTELDNIKNIINQSVNNEKEWDSFKLYFEEVNKGFFEKLLSLNPTLNTYELRHCALIKLNLNVKETASTLYVSPNTVKSARYRLKKKLGLKPDEDLSAFLRKL